MGELIFLDNYRKDFNYEETKLVKCEHCDNKWVTKCHRKTKILQCPKCNKVTNKVFVNGSY